MTTDKWSNMHRWAFLTVHSILITTQVQSFSPLSASNTPETLASCQPSIILLNRISNRHTSSSILYQRKEADDENTNEDDLQDQSNDDTEEPTWIEKAMDTTPEDPTTGPSLEPPPLTTMRHGISGFAVDPGLGFVCVLHHDNENDGVDGPHRFVHTVISPLDRTTVQSAEALCLVQLAGGLDLGAVVFPPDTLARLIKRELDDDDGDSSSKASVEEL